ncbi:hypothetical protein SISNIDRAFT_481603 [Sistotremastrum niveocremeum HHB9708]|uniref:Uncharacterized protein n=2 Tax=Sistotremastraceae TaxID=3402574 RepID=A0A164ZGE0_9AGAM|nr:hypothetical protein SISNIDRAFT_481603 [Sistotremastrum niveocremeum HHB9708]KZT41145.1 hypothetical protein SISSUDRAFT_370585 [Sistotremastrum suecicum HHB10207 ss-3]
MSTTTTVTRQMTDEEKRIEKIWLKETKAEETAIAHALKDLQAAEKAHTKSAKQADKAIHTHDKTVKKEHKTAKALNSASQKHDNAVADERKALKNIEIKRQHQSKLEQDIAAKKMALEQAERRKNTGDTEREARRKTFASNNPTYEQTPHANLNMPQTGSPTNMVGPTHA